MDFGLSVCPLRHSAALQFDADLSPPFVRVGSTKTARHVDGCDETSAIDAHESRRLARNQTSASPLNASRGCLRPSGLSGCQLAALSLQTGVDVTSRQRKDANAPQNWSGLKLGPAQKTRPDRPKMPCCTSLGRAGPHCTVCNSTDGSSPGKL